MESSDAGSPIQHLGRKHAGHQEAEVRGSGQPQPRFKVHSHKARIECRKGRMTRSINTGGKSKQAGAATITQVNTRASTPSRSRRLLPRALCVNKTAIP